MKPWHTPRRRQVYHDRKERHLALAKMRSHFATRCKERVRGVDAFKLWNELTVAIGLRLEQVELRSKVPGGRECWRFMVGERTFYAIYDPRFLCPVTVMKPGQSIFTNRGKKKRLAA